MSNCVLVERRGPVQVITMNRPEAKNAINRELSLGVAAALDLLDADPELSIGVLTGAGGAFSAGMDLKAFLAGEDARPDGRGLAGICRQTPAKPVIAAVEGWALAGGCEVALACDLVVAGDDAKFGIPEVRRGLIAGDGGLLRLARRLPPAIAMELALTGQPITATDAQRHGLINRVVPAGTALEVAVELAAVIAGNAPIAIAASRKIVLSALDQDIASGMLQQDELLNRAMASDDAAEGARAFAEKRQPTWTGR